MTTNRNRTMIAPANTISVPTRARAAWTGWRAATTSTPPAIARAATIRKPITPRPPRSGWRRPSVVDAFQLGPRVGDEAEPHVGPLRGRLAALPLAALRAHEHVFLAVDEVLVAVVGELELVAEDDRARGARLLAHATEDAPEHVDLVDPRVALARRDGARRVVLGGLDVDRVRGARRRAQRAADALLEARVGVPEQVMAAPEARLYPRGLLGRSEERRVGKGCGARGEQ